MNEIKETLSVLKTRWFEAFCIVVPWAVFIPLVGLFEKIHPLKGTEAIFVSHIYLLTYICLSLFILLIKGGFLRTVYIEQKKRQSISNLTKAGKHFFSRLLRFYIL
ncbi:MAG: hypothetical protein JW806_03455, partial [Sedimentisphaerales bacterium]|nr:hypothetical protein [Sedimentisphaerales bacterium]